MSHVFERHFPKMHQAIKPVFFRLYSLKGFLRQGRGQLHSAIHRGASLCAPTICWAYTVWPGRGIGRFWSHMTGAMQDPANERLRKSLLRTPVNKGIRKGRSCYEPRVFST